mgnify:CR=1 FL=1
MYQEEVKSAIILLYLGILAGMDVRKRQISLVLTGVLFLAGIGWQILVEQTSWLEWLLSLLPGAGFLTLSYISREQVGYGDGLLLLTVGIWLGFGQTFGVLTLGLILCSVLCGVLLMRKKYGNRILYRWCRFCCLDLWGGAECFESENEKASITVEAVLVVPLVLMVYFSSAVADIFCARTELVYICGI